MTAWRERAVERATKRRRKEEGHHRLIGFRDGATLLSIVRAIELSGVSLTVERIGRLDPRERSLLPKAIEPTLFGAAPTVFVA